MDVIELQSLTDLLSLSYDALLAALRLPWEADIKERLQAELKSRERALYNQWVQVCGGEFK